MIWRILVRRSSASSIAAKRLLIGVLFFSALDAALNQNIAQAQLIEAADVPTPELQRPASEDFVVAELTQAKLPQTSVAIAKAIPEFIDHQPAFSPQPTPQQTSLELAQNPNSNTEALPTVEPLPVEPEQPIQNADPRPDPRPTDGDRQIAVNQINITGSSVFQDADFAPILANVAGNSVPLSQLQQAADEITQLYLDKGYITSRAILVEDSLGSGNIELRVIEGYIDQINISGTKRLGNNYLRDRLRFGAGTPLNTNTLEDQLRLLKLNPAIENIDATLKAGDGLGQSDLDISVTEADTISLNLGADNYSPASVGSERMTLDLVQENLTGGSDRLGLGYIRTTRGGAESLDLNYTLPINAKDGSITLRSVFSRNKVVQAPFDVLNIRGESERYDISYRQPIIRNPRKEVALGVGFTYQDGLTFLGNELFGFNVGTENGKSTTSVLKFTQEYITRQPTSAFSLRSQFSLGTGLFDATRNDEPIPDGIFWGWLGQVQRAKLLNPNNLLIIQADLQLTPDSLLPSQQFVMGGGQSLRGFRQNARSADNGLRFSIEDRITLARNEAGESIFQVAPFFDMGTVWNSDNNPNKLPSQTFLAGLGVGAWWQIEEGLTVRLDYALPLVDLKDRGNNIQDHGLYFNVNYLF